MDKRLYTQTAMILVLITGLYSFGCSRNGPGLNDSTESNMGPNGSQVDLAQPPVSIPVASRQRIAEDQQRLWLPPMETRFVIDENDGEDAIVELKDMRQIISSAKDQAMAALASNHLHDLSAAEHSMLHARRTLYALAVRMRQQWTKMEYQTFLSEMQFHELLKLSNAIDERSAAIAREKRLWGPPQD